jgi:hypothetical protein
MTIGRCTEGGHCDGDSTVCGLTPTVTSSVKNRYCDYYRKFLKKNCVTCVESNPVLTHKNSYCLYCLRNPKLKDNWRPR